MNNNITQMDDSKMDPEDGDILKQLQAIQTLLDGVIAQLCDDSEEDATEGPETEENPVAAMKKSLLGSVKR